MATKTTVYPIQESTNVDVGATPVEILIEDKRHTVESTTQPNPVEIIIPSATVYTAGIQGPAGPPTGLFEEVEALNFVGSGEGATKTTTGINDNTIYEEFGVLDELFVIWVIPDGLDRTKDCYFKGSFFPLVSDVGTDCSWEIHVTGHSLTNGIEVNGTIYANDLPLEETAFIHSHGSALIDHTIFLVDGIDIMHIRLKRVASSNDPIGKVGVSDLSMRYATDGKVGVAGEAGPEGPAGGVDAIIYHYTAIQGQTVFTGADDNSDVLSYTLGSVSFALNGVELFYPDVIETDTSTLTLVEGCEVDDVVEITAYAQGEAAGGGTASFEYEAIAGENMGAYKLVRIDLGTAYLADKDDIANIGEVLGLTTAVSTTGNPVTIQTGGEISDTSWTWSKGSVFMGDSGELTQTPPTVGVLQKVGTVLTATSILIDIDDPVLRT